MTIYVLFNTYKLYKKEERRWVNEYLREQLSYKKL